MANYIVKIFKRLKNDNVRSIFLLLLLFTQNSDNGHKFCILYYKLYIYCIIFENMFIILLRIIKKN